MKFSYQITFIVFLALIVGFVVQAEVPPDVTFPVAELGSCESEEKCKAYCDLAEHLPECLGFSEAHNLMSPGEIALARRVLAAGETGGPGGCRSREACEVYCEKIEHIEECIAAAEQYDLLEPDELEEAKKIAAAIRQGHTPPLCGGREECDVYCSEPAHMEECLAFATAANLIPPEELEEAKKVLQAIKQGAIPPPCQGREECEVYCQEPDHLASCLEFAEAAGLIPPDELAEAKKFLRGLKQGIKPPPCGGREECDAYCSEPAHMEECLTFAVSAGLIPPDELEEAEKVLKAIQAGVKPPPCRGEQDCEAYCSVPEHTEECFAFAEAAGFITPEEADLMRKTGGAGPGGCRGREVCEAYCEGPDHFTECIDFAEKAGFMTPEEVVRAREMLQRGITAGPGGCKSEEECRGFCENPEHIDECIDFAVQIGEMTSEEAEQIRQYGTDVIEQGGPGGCRGEEECKLYCEDPAHLEECLNFSVQQGFTSPEAAQRLREGAQGAEHFLREGELQFQEGGIPGGPGGCVTPEECIKYCSEPERFEECASFLGPGSMPQQEQRFPFQQERTLPIVELVLRFLLASVGLVLGL